MTTPRTTDSGLHAIDHSPVPGLVLYERRVAEPEATLIAVHGGLDRGGSFARLARRSSLFDVVTYDRRGYQASRDLQPINLAAHRDDLLALASAYRARGPVILLGHSYGGVVALAAKIAAPDVADALVCFETPLPWIYRRPGFTNDLGSDPAVEAEKFFQRMVSPTAWARLSDAEQDSRRHDGPALLDDLRTLRAPAPFTLSTLDSPWVYSHGDGERAAYYDELTSHLRREFPQVTVRVVPGASHGAHLSSPDQLMTVVRDAWRSTCE